MLAEELRALQQPGVTLGSVATALGVEVSGRVQTLAGSPEIAFDVAAQPRATVDRGQRQE